MKDREQRLRQATWRLGAILVMLLPQALSAMVPPGFEPAASSYARKAKDLKKAEPEQDFMVLDRIRKRLDQIKATPQTSVKRTVLLNQLQQVFQEAEHIRDRSLQSEAFGAVVSLQVDVGAFDDAVKTAGRIQDHNLRIQALSFITGRREGIVTDPSRLAFVEAQLGDIAAAKRAAERVEDALARSYVLEGVTLQQAKVGDWEGALQLAEAIPDVRIRVVALSRLAVEEAKADYVEKAMQAVSGIRDEKAHDEVLVGLVKLRLRKKDFAGAKELAAHVHTTEGRHLVQRALDAHGMLQPTLPPD